MLGSYKIGTIYNIFLTFISEDEIKFELRGNLYPYAMCGFILVHGLLSLY